MSEHNYDISDNPEYEQLCQSLPEDYVIFGYGTLYNGTSECRKKHPESEQLCKALRLATKTDKRCNENYLVTTTSIMTRARCQDVLFWGGCIYGWIGTAGGIRFFTRDIFALRRGSLLLDLVVDIFPHMWVRVEKGVENTKLLREEF